MTVFVVTRRPIMSCILNAYVIRRAHIKTSYRLSVVVLCMLRIRLMCRKGVRIQYLQQYSKHQKKNYYCTSVALVKFKVRG